MKCYLFLFLFLWNVGNLTAQELYIPGKVTKGENASYYCSSINEFYIEVRNVLNTDTTKIVYDKNGQIVKNGFYYVLGTYQFSKDDLFAVLKEIFIKEEWEKIYERKRFILWMHIVLDDTGKAKEITFQFRKDDPIFTRLEPDRLYVIEQRFKQILKFQLAAAQKTHKNPKCSYQTRWEF